VATFSIGKPITTREPFIEVDPGLKPGTHRFQLEVETTDGRLSPPDVVAVTVVDRITDPLVLRDIITNVLLTNRDILR
jgi:hypothetical protein